MKRLFQVLVALCAVVCPQAFPQSRIGGRAYASAYGTWSARLVVGAGPGTSTVLLDNCIFQVPGGRDIFPISTGTPLLLTDSNSESATPSAVTIPVISTTGGPSAYTCTATVTLSNAHLAGTYVTFADGGVGAAVKDLKSGIVVLDPGSYSTMAVTSMPGGNSNVSIADERTGPEKDYCWGGSSYALCPVTGGNGIWGFITGSLSSQADVTNALNLKAPLASPALTGTPTAPTASPGTNTTQVATTAFVQASGGGPGAVVNLLSAGAVCNGSTDDTAAIQAAYATLTATYGGTIYWPPPGKTCVLSDTVTLANSQATHIIGGAVTWRGSPLNATASTAAQSGNVVTLTTTSGNWGSAFIVGGSVKVSGCSVTGYNGLAKIISGGTGGATLTYIAAGATTGLGAATGCSAATLKPMFVYDEDISTTTESFRVTGGGTSQPLGVGFSIKQDSTYGVASQGNIFKGNIVEGQVTGGLNIGFEVTHGSSSNPTNDEHKFFGNNIYNFSTAGFTIDFFQSVDIGFYSNTCYGINLVSLSCVIDTSGSGFNWVGGFTFGSMLADFYGYGQTAHPITIDSVGSEGSARLTWISQSGQNPTSAPCPVNLINDRFASNSLAADGWAVVYECPGPLNVHGGSYGQFNTSFPTFCWCSTYVSGENYAFGSIIGVDASANNSLGHPLLNIPFADANTVINIVQGGNIYTKSNQGGAPPTNPDKSYNAVHMLAGFPNTYDIGSQAYSWANIYGVNTITTDPSFGSKQTETSAACENAYAATTASTGGATTDTGANCLPANAVIDAVVYRITTTVTTAASFTVGDATIAARFCGTQSTMTAATTGVCFAQADQTGTSGPRQGSAAKVRVTFNTTPGAGAIRLIVYYHTWTPPTS